MTDQIADFFSKLGTVTGVVLQTSQVFRDVSGWYHIVVAG
jgi:hypothetical protein